MESKRKTITKNISKITKVDGTDTEKLAIIINDFYSNLNKLKGPLDFDFSQHIDVLDKIQSLINKTKEKSNAQDNIHSNKAESNEDLMLIYLRAFLVLKQKIANINPFLKPYEQSILLEISKLKNINRKAKYYYIYTNYFTNFDSVDFDELIKVDNYYSNEYFILEEKEKVKKEKISCFKNYCSFYHEKFIESDKEINNYEFLKLEIIIENILLQILNLIKIINVPNQREKIHCDITEIIYNIFGKLNAVFMFYLENIKKKVNEKLVQKVIYVLLYFYSFCNQGNYNKELKFDEFITFIEQIIEANWKKYFPYITNLFFIFLQTIKSQTQYSYLTQSDGFKGDIFPLYTKGKVIEKKALLPEDYAQTLNSIFLFNPNYNIYKGCLLFISQLFLKSNKNFETHEIVRLFYFKMFNEMVITMEDKVKDELNIYSEIIRCIYCITSSYQKEITLREWKMIIKAINSMTIYDLEAIKKSKANGQVIFKLIKYFHNCVHSSWLKSNQFNTEIEMFISIKDQDFDELNMDLVLFKLYFTFNSTFLVFKDLLGACIVKYIINRGVKEKEGELSTEVFLNISFQLINFMYEIIINPNNDFKKDDSDNNNEKASDVIEHLLSELYPHIINSIFEVIRKEEENKVYEHKFTELLNNLKNLIITLFIQSKKEKVYVKLFKHFMKLVTGDIRANTLTELSRKHGDFVLGIINDILIQLNSVKYISKMKQIMNVILSKENGKFIYQYRTRKCISLFRFSKSGQILIVKPPKKNTKEKQEIINQEDPCLILFREGIKIDNDNYYYVDLDEIFSEYLNNLLDLKCQNFILYCFEHFQFLSLKIISSTIDTILNEGLNITFSPIILTLLALYNDLNIPKEIQEIKKIQDTQNNNENYIINKEIFPNEPIKEKIVNYFLDLIPKFYYVLSEKSELAKRPKTIIKTNEISTLPMLKTLITLLAFYLNSTDNYKNIDKNIPKAKAHYQEIIKNIIHNILNVVAIIEQINVESGLFLIVTLFIFKEQIAKCNSDLIILCIYICLLLGYPKKFPSLNRNFEKYYKFKQDDLYFRKPCKINQLGNHKTFVAFLSDIICLYLISYVKPGYQIFQKDCENNNEKGNSIRATSYLNLLYSTINALNKDNENENCKRLSIFKDLCYSILCLEQNFRCNITPEMKEKIKSSIYNMKVFIGKNDVQLFDIKNNTTDVYLINSVSQVKFSYYYETNFFSKQSRREQYKLLKSILSVPISNSNNDNNNNEDNINKDEQIELDKHSMHPFLLYEKHIYEEKRYSKDCNNSSFNKESEIEKQERIKTKRILHSPNEEITKDKEDKINLIFSLLDISTSFEIHVTVSFIGSASAYKERYINFLSLIGKLYESTNDNYTLIYKDLFYNVIFDLIDTEKSNEEKAEIIKRNNIHIIWNDNKENDINVLEKEYISQTCQDKQNMLIFVTPLSDKLYQVKRGKIEESNDKMISFVDSMFMNTYLINSTSNSGVRYLMNNIILISEWLKYHSSAFNSNENETMTNVEYSNNLTQRQDILSKLYIFFCE